MVKLTAEYEVLTPYGFKDFKGIKKTKGKYIELEFSSGDKLKCSYSHKILVEDSFIRAENLIVGQVIENKHIISIKKYEEEIELFDLLEVADGHVYYTNNIPSSNCAFVPRTKFSEFYKSVYPTISSGTESRFITVSTPNGMNHFYDMWIAAMEKKSAFVPFEVNWWDVPGRDEAWKTLQLQNMSEEDFAQEYGNSFQGSLYTLLRSDTLARLDSFLLNPSQSSKDISIFKEPVVGRTYIGTVDCADTGSDASTISIIDITSYPYEQVARYDNASISHLMFPHMILNLASKYNNADVLVENNDVGKVILHILNYDLGYEHVISTRSGNKLQLGQRTTSKTKPIGCARLKDMIESGKLVIRDKKTATELRHFVISGHSYAAEDGYHDDLVMGLVNFAYYCNTETFRYHHDENFTDEYRKEFENSLLESLAPIPMFSNTVYEDDDSFDMNSFLRN